MKNINLIFAETFKINIKNIPEGFLKYLYKEIKDHLNDGLVKDAKITVEFLDVINDNGNVFLSLLSSKNKGEEIFFYDKYNKKMNIKNYSKKNKIYVEKEFNKEYLFDILEHIFMQKIVEDGKCFLHCSAFEINNYVYVFPACNNTGKTKLMVELIRNNNAKYIGDDWAIVDKNGRVYPYYRSIRFYINDYIYNKDIIKAKIPFDFLIGNYFDRKKMSLMQRFYIRVIQKIYFPFKLGREELERKKQAPFLGYKNTSKVYFYTRASIKKPENQIISSEVITKKMVNAILNENTKKPDFENWVGFLEDSQIKHKEEFERQLEEILGSFFDRVEKMWIKVPLNYKPMEIKRYFMELEEFKYEV